MVLLQKALRMSALSRIVPISCVNKILFVFYKFHWKWICLMQWQDLRNWLSFSLLKMVKWFSRNIFSTKKNLKEIWFLLSPGPLKGPELVKKLVQFFHASSQFKLFHKRFSSSNIQCCLLYKNVTPSFQENITSNYITHLFPMPPFSTPMKTLENCNVFWCFQGGR